MTAVEKLQAKYDDEVSRLDHLRERGGITRAELACALRSLDAWFAIEMRTAVDLDAQDAEEAAEATR